MASSLGASGDPRLAEVDQRRHRVVGALDVAGRKKVQQQPAGDR
jgi:hypothetical protein